MAFSGYQDLYPEFGTALERMVADRPGITPFSGYRDYAHQARLFQAALQKYGSYEAARHNVAPPGSSNHNFRLAADLMYATPEDEAWAHAHAADYGLNFRMGHEPRHIELANAMALRGKLGNQQGGQQGELQANATVPPPSNTQYAVPPPQLTSAENPAVIRLKRVDPFTSGGDIDPNGPNERNNYSMNLLNDAIAKREDRIMKLRKQLLEGIKSYS